MKLRIEALSDLVFGLALSLGAIALIQHIPQDASALTNDVETFAFSFLIIVMIWLGYTRVVSVSPVETQVAILLNLVLLFCVALEPFLYYVQALQTTDTPFLDFSSSAYALDIGSMMALIAGMMYIAVYEETHGKVKKLGPVILRRFKVGTVLDASVAAVFLVSASPVFWVQVPGYGFLRFLVWYTALAAFIVSRTARRFSAKEPAAVST
jgi:uncharacterized membrane protein